MEQKQTLQCNRCKVPLTLARANFSYLNRTLQHEVLRCPNCGQVYLPEDLVRDKMLKVEASLEEK